MKKFSCLFLTVSLLLLTACPGEEISNPGNLDKTDKPEEPITSSTVGKDGGELSVKNIHVSIPAGSFAADTKMELKKQTGENVFGTNKASEYYTITGIPVDFSKPVTITVTPDENAGANLFMAMGEESFVPSLNKMEVNYSFVESTLKEGKYLFNLTPAETDNDAKGKTMDLTFGLVKDFACKGGGTKSTRASSKFQIYYDTKKVRDYDAEKLEKYLNDAYDELVNMGFSFSKRTSWPISAYLYNRQSYSQNRLGEFVSSKFGNNWSYMTFNAGYMSDQTLMKSTAGHELFHLVQALYDPRWAFTKAISAGNFYWLDEATATWFEEIMAGEAYSSPTRKGHHMEPLKGVYKGANENPQHYGYGMAAFVKSMVGQTDKSTLSNIYQKISEGAENPVKAINGGASKTVSEMYPFFLDEYFNGKVYSDFEQSSLLTAEGVQTWNIASEGDTLKTFDNAYPGISTKIFKLNLSHDGFDDNSTLIIKTDEIAFAPKFVYKMQGGSVFKLLDMGKSELSITGLKQLQKDKALILAVVANSGYTDNNFKTTFNIVKMGGFKPIRAAVKLYIEGESNGSVSNVQATTGGIYATNHIKGSFSKNTFTASFDTESGSDGDPLKIRNMGNFTITFNPTGDRIVSGTFKLERDRTWTDRDGTTANDYEIATFKIRDIPINTIWKKNDIFNADYEEKGTNVGNKIYDVEYNSRYRDFNNTITTSSFDKITRLRVDVDLKEKE